MGHYAGEMDFNWGQPSPSERKLSEVPEEEIQELARCLFKGFDSGSYLGSTNREYGIKVATAIDSLVCKLISEALGVTSSLGTELEL